jgi:hypothetical protein
VHMVDIRGRFFSQIMVGRVKIYFIAFFLPARACNARAGLHSAFCCCCWGCGGGGGCFTQLLRISSWLHVE